MAQWKNPTHRVFKGETYYLAGEGLEKAAAQGVAKTYRPKKKARVLRDERLGRIKWCVYVEE